MCVSVSGLAKVNTCVSVRTCLNTCVSVSGLAKVNTWVCAYMLEYVCECEWTRQGEYVWSVCTCLNTCVSVS